MDAALAQSPEEIITALEARSERRETPMTNGALVWHIWGEGPPLLLLHGGHGSWTHWTRNIEFLAGFRRILVPDLPGFGESALPERRDHGPDFAQPIIDGLRQLAPGDAPIDVVGFSTGGVVAAHMAAMAPDLVRRLVLIDAGGLDTPVDVPPMRPIRGLEGADLDEATRFNLSLMMFRDPASADDLALLIQGRNAPRGRARGRDIVLPDLLQQVLPDVNAPIDVIWAEYDALHPDPDLQLAAVRRAHPEVGMTVIKGSGHWVMYEAADDFNAALRGILETPLRQG